MELEEALQKIATLEADKADVLRNFSAYRKNAEKKEEELTGQLETSEKDLKKQLETTQWEFETFKQNIDKQKETERTTYLETKIEEMSKGDKKIADNLRAEYALLNMPEDSTESIQARLDKSSAILNVSKPVGAWEAAWAGSGVSGWNGGSNEALTPNVLSLLAHEWISAN